MNEGLRLRAADSDFHFLSHDNADEYVEWIEAEGCHHELSRFVRDMPAGKKVTLHFSQDGVLTFNSDTSELSVDLPIYLASSSQINLFLGFLEPGGEIHFTKMVWTAKKYNHWLRWESGCCDQEVYPEVCPKCESLMACSSEHYSRRQNNWKRVRCTNERCNFVLAKDEFVDHFRPRNQKKLLEMLAKDIADHAVDVTMIDAAGVPIQNPFPWKDASNDFCRECGGETGPWRIIRSSRMTSVLYCCRRCYGRAHFMHTDISMNDAEIVANIERARKEREKEARACGPN